MNELVFRNANGVPMTTSVLVAKTFGKEHKHVLRDIDNLECSEEFTASNFGLCMKIRELANGVKKQDRYYNITKDGFTFLAMGYTGKKAAEFKEKYIAAFNAMAQQLSQGATLTQQFMETQMQMMGQMMTLCNSLMQRLERLESAQQPQAKPKKSSATKVVEPVVVSSHTEEYPWESVIKTYRNLRLRHPKHISVIQAARLLTLRGVCIRHTTLFRFLRENGLISAANATYHRPSAECVKKGWMVCIYGRSSADYPGRRYHTPYLSPEFVDILERRLTAHSVKALDLWKGVAE